MNKISMMKKMVLVLLCVVSTATSVDKNIGAVPVGAVHESLLNPSTWLAIARSVGGALKWPVHKGLQEAPVLFTKAFELCQAAPLLTAAFASVYLWNNADSVVDTCNFVSQNRWSLTTVVGAAVVQDVCAKYPAGVAYSLVGSAIGSLAYFAYDTASLRSFWAAVSNAATTKQKLCRAAVFSTILGGLWNFC